MTPATDQPVAITEPKSPLRFIVPLAVFVILAGFLYVGLGLNPREVPSPFIGKPAPAFQLAQLARSEQSFSPAQMKGEVWLLNVWASWCAPCRVEHPLLVQVAEDKVVPIIGMNYKDKRDAALGWLAQLGDPYKLSVADNDGRVAIDYGVYGVPETFIVGRDGKIAFKLVGPITAQNLETAVKPAIERALR